MKARAFLLGVVTMTILIGLRTPSASAGVIFNDPRIDRIATDAAGVSIHVDCYNNYDVWRHDWDQDENRTFFGAASGAKGQFFIMLSPTVCFTLVKAFDEGPAAAGAYWSSLSLLTLLHISIIQGNIERGLTRGWRYDGAGSCVGLKVLPQFASKIGFTKTIRTQSLQPVRKQGKIVGWRRVFKTVTNPAYRELLKSAADWHLFLFGAPCL